MSIKQIALPDLTSLALSGTTVWLFEAVTFSDDERHLVVKATFTEDGSQGEQRYGYFIYDIAQEAFVVNLNEVLLDSAQLTTANIDDLVFTGNLDNYSVVAEVSDSGSDTGRLVHYAQGQVQSTNLIADTLGEDFAVNVERFTLASDARHLVLQTTNPNLASELILDANDSSDIYIIDMQTLAVTRVSVVGGGEVNSGTFLQSVNILNNQLQVSFISDEAYVSSSRVDTNTADISGPVGTRTDAYVWQAPLGDDGSLGTTNDFILISTLPNGTASGFVSDDYGVFATSAGQYFSATSELIDINDNNNAADAFVSTNAGVQILQYNNERLDGETQIVDTNANGRYVLLLSNASQVSGSTGAQQLIFIDTQSGEGQVISQNSAQVAGDNVSLNAVMSGVGSQVAFTSLASNLTNELPNAFTGSLFLRTLDGFNSPVTGTVDLANFALLGEDLALDFSNLADEDGLGEFSVDWFRNGEAVASSSNTLSTATATSSDAFSAVVSYVDGQGTTETLDIAPFSLVTRPQTEDAELGFTAKYIIIGSSGENYFDLSLGFDELNTLGQSSLISGFSTVEAIKVSAGQMVDITNLKGSQDKIYLPGELADYLPNSSIDSNSGVMTLIRNKDFSYTEVKFIATNSASDQLVFADGVVSSADLKTYFQANDGDTSVIDISSAETSISPQVTSTTSEVKVIVLDNSGETVSSFAPDTTVQISGGSGVDKVYVKAGTAVDATNLKSSVDEVYLQGQWSEYTKTFDISGNLILSRSVSINGQNHTEEVSVASGSTIATNDLLVFADGAIRTADAVSAIRADAADVFATISGFDPSKTTPLLNDIDPAFIVAEPAAKASQTDIDLLNAVTDLSESAQPEGSVVEHSQVAICQNHIQQEVSHIVFDESDNGFELYW